MPPAEPAQPQPAMAPETGTPPYEEGGEGGEGPEDDGDQICGMPSKNARPIPKIPPRRSSSLDSTGLYNSGLSFFQGSSNSRMWRTSGRRNRTGWRGKVSCFVRHPAFDFTMCLIVVANSLSIGMEQAWRLEERETTLFDMIEHAFLAIYILELVLRMVEGGLSNFSNNWVRVDMVIVATGIATNWVLVPIIGSSNKMSSLLVLRMTRLLRLARTLKLVIRCRELLMLVQGLVNSVSTMIHTLMLCCIILYVLGCMSLELITLPSRELGQIDEEILDIIDGNFPSLPMAMLSLVQFMTFDNVVYIYKPLIEADPTLAIFFMSVIMVMGVVFMNLVTAIIVNGAVEQAMQDKDIQKHEKESKRKKLIAKLKDAFYRADTDESGEITREELKDIDAEDQDLLKKVLGIDDLTELFDQLDVDGDGEIGIEEFCTGIERIVVSETSIEFKRMERMMNSMHKQLKALHTEHDGLRRFLEEKMSSASGPLFLEPAEGGAPDAPERTVDRPTPSWVGQLTLELKEACTADVRRAMDEACAAFMAQVWDGAATPPETPRALGAASDASSCRSPRSSCLSPRGKWEALPPGQGPQAPPSARSPPGQQREATRPTRRGGPGQEAPPQGAQGPVLGGFVPEAGRPSLLREAPCKTAEALPARASARPGDASAWRRREEL